MARPSTAAKTNAEKEWLASWQDLNKYDEARNLGAYRWGLQLSARAKSPITEHLYRELKDSPMSIGAHEMAIHARAPVQDMSHVDLAQQAALYEHGGVKGTVDDWNEKYAKLPVSSRVLRKV